MPVTDFADCPIVELRRYQLRPQGFDELQRVFQGWLVDGQEQAGMRLGGQFRDRRSPDRFVWFRGFASMTRRQEALEAFYFGPAWRAHRDAANATMLDSDDVLLLRPTEPPHSPRPPAGAGGTGPTDSDPWAVVHVWSKVVDEAEALLCGGGHKILEQALGAPVAMWRTEPAENTFPRLPVQPGRHIVALTVFEDETQWRSATDRLRDDPGWRDVVERLDQAGVVTGIDLLQPTAASRHPRPVSRRRSG
ncbi:NIPSNAP family protein [Actinoplanes sp. TRM 88003]|uniref:NIPSNAP family protein n=1 Tax=Paractinoplanes aksuensis TaxID=2939490 RepID=A0ABT1E1X4_9ACTN|nr:NIPSNAP family protein [Actinoplanes aksuensis]MCO8276261.1 NIPSNAP family protein [Actinoplanes aksuensis]